MNDYSEKIDKLMKARYKGFEESNAAWKELREYITPLVGNEKKEIIAKINSHFMLLGIDDMLLIGMMTAPLMVMPKSFCLKCGKELENEKL